MNRRLRVLGLLLCAVTMTSAPSADDPPTDWIDPDTGHSVIRIFSEPGSQTLYFHDNAYSPEGDEYVFSSPSGIMLLDFTTLGTQPPKPELIVPGASGAYMARRSREVYFTRRGVAAGRRSGVRHRYEDDSGSPARRTYADQRRRDDDRRRTVSRVERSIPTAWRSSSPT